MSPIDASFLGVRRTCFLLLAAWSCCPQDLAAQIPIFDPFVTPSSNDVNTAAANAVVLTNTVAQGCTGVLIREDLVLSAAHCSPPSFDGAGITPNVWHRVETFDTTRAWNVQFGNDRNNLIHTARVSHFSSSFGNDIVLLALERPVSPTIAIPIPPLLANPPVDWSTQSFTLVGWGANNDAGSSFPRFRQVVAGSNGMFPCGDPNRFCVLNGGPQARGGDSGGPLLWTDRAGRRFVLGELQNSGGQYYPTFGPGSTTQGSIATWLTNHMANPNPNAALQRNCINGNRPAASLLIPYFEVDLDNPAGATTLASIQNRSTRTIQVHVVLWTDWAKPTLNFDLTLQPLGLQTINLRDTLSTGRPPQTQPFSGCPNTNLTPAFMRAAHTGQAVAGGCLSRPRTTGIATGFITVDTVLAGYCGRSGDLNPWDTRYFAEDLGRRARDENVLSGDFFLVNPAENYAQGFDAAALVADPTRFRSGIASFSFWGRFVDYEGRDHRAPLPDTWSARYGVGGGFDAGTDYFVWRDPGDDNVSPVSCAAGPVWFPLGEASVTRRPEPGSPATNYTNPSFFPLATQRVPVANLAPAGPFGSFLLNLGLPTGTSTQAWLGWTMSASGRFSVGQTGVPTHDLCDPLGILIGPPGGLMTSED